MESAFGDTYGEAWTRSQVAGILPMAGVSLILARSATDGGCAGFSLARAVADEAELLLIAVLPDHRRRGVGRDAARPFRRRSAASAGCAGSISRSAMAMRRPRCTASCGFEPVGRRRDYYKGADRRRHDAITFARNL